MSTRQYSGQFLSWPQKNYRNREMPETLYVYLDGVAKKVARLVTRTGETINKTGEK